MAYDVYLQLGFPIASGVIEGACRCVVKDRMERSGMRWVLSGARAMLSLRCISLSRLWDEYMSSVPNGNPPDRTQDMRPMTPIFAHLWQRSRRGLRVAPDEVWAIIHDSFDAVDV